MYCWKSEFLGVEAETAMNRRRRESKAGETTRAGWEDINSFVNLYGHSCGESQEMLRPSLSLCSLPLKSWLIFLYLHCSFPALVDKNFPLILCWSCLDWTSALQSPINCPSIFSYVTIQSIVNTILCYVW